MNVDCSTFATVSDCVNNGPDTDTFKNHCCEVSNENLPPCAGVGSDKSNCCLDVNSHCAWTGDACVEIENLGGNTDQCGVDDSSGDGGGGGNLPPCALLVLISQIAAWM